MNEIITLSFDVLAVTTVLFYPFIMLIGLIINRERMTLNTQLVVDSIIVCAGLLTLIAVAGSPFYTVYTAGFLSMMMSFIVLSSCLTTSFIIAGYGGLFGIIIGFISIAMFFGPVAVMLCFPMTLAGVYGYVAMFAGSAYDNPLWSISAGWVTVNVTLLYTLIFISVLKRDAYYQFRFIQPLWVIMNVAFPAFFVYGQLEKTRKFSLSRIFRKVLFPEMLMALSHEQRQLQLDRDWIHEQNLARRHPFIWGRKQEHYTVPVQSDTVHQDVERFENEMKLASIKSDLRGMMSNHGRVHGLN